MGLFLIFLFTSPILSHKVQISLKGGDKNNQTYEPLKATTRCKRERSPALKPWSNWWHLIVWKKHGWTWDQGSLEWF